MMENQFNLTVEEMIVVLFELEKVEQAKELISTLEELGKPEVIENTLKVATRSLISKEILEVVDEQYVFNPLFKALIEGYLNPITTMRASKIYNDAELSVFVFKTQEGLFISHSLDEFIFRFNIYEDGEELLQSLVTFSNITEGEQIVTTPLKLKEDVTKLLFDNEQDLHRELLIENNVPSQLVETILEDYSIIRHFHSYIILNEEFDFIKPMFVVQSEMRSWASYETEEGIEFANYSHKNLKAYLREHFFSGIEQWVE